MIDTCYVCGKPVPDYEPQWCCNGSQCGCRGLPVEPPFCSGECEKKAMEPKPSKASGNQGEP